MMKRIGLRNGFTLIELLIIISIMGILMTTGVAYYQNFNRRQIVVQAAKELKNNLRLAQSKALSGEKPNGCSGILRGYRVHCLSESYSITAICDGEVEYKSYSLDGVEWAGCPPYILFKPLASGVENAGEMIVSGPNHSSKVIVEGGGNISLEENIPYVSPFLPPPLPSPSPPPPSPTPTPCAGLFQSCMDLPCCEGRNCWIFICF